MYFFTLESRSTQRQTICTHNHNLPWLLKLNNKPTMTTTHLKRVRVKRCCVDLLAVHMYTNAWYVTYVLYVYGPSMYGIKCCGIKGTIPKSKQKRRNRGAERTLHSNHFTLKNELQRLPWDYILNRRQPKIISPCQAHVVTFSLSGSMFYLSFLPTSPNPEIWHVYI